MASQSIQAKCAKCGSTDGALQRYNLRLGMSLFQWCANCIPDMSGDHELYSSGGVTRPGRKSSFGALESDATPTSASDAKDFSAYMAQLRTVLEQRGKPCALKISAIFGACLNQDGSIVGFYLDGSGTFDFDANAWNGDCWDDEEPAQTWGALRNPEYIPLPVDPELP